MNNGSDLLDIEECTPGKAKPARASITSRSKILEILKNFDYPKVNRTMIHLNWQWAGEGIPTLASLETRSKELLEKLAKKPVEDPNIAWSMEISTGGFIARRFGGADDLGQWENFELLFAVADWATEEE